MRRYFFRLYILSFYLYPKEFRTTYGDAMVQTLTDMLDDQPTYAGKMRVCMRAGLDLQRSVIREQLQTKGEILMRTTNKFLIAGIWLVLAIIGALTLPMLRHIGTTWTDWPGFVRVIGLLGFLIGFIVLPILLSVLSLFGITQSIAKRITTTRS